eukprot:gene6642-3299_t
MRSLGTSGAAGRLTLLLNHEIGAVETAMRFNSKWAVVPRYYEEDRNEPNKYDNAFRVLRSEIFKYTDWTVVDPLVYLAPFLALIKASDVSGPITGAAAVALQRIINSELLGLTTTNVEGAINKIIEEATQCKFESTSHAQDEIVLLNIVQVLGQSVDCEAGILLADDTICKAFKATFMLGDPVTKPKEYGDIMGYYSRHICAQMIRTVFGRLRDLASFEKTQAANASVGAPDLPALAPKHGMQAANASVGAPAPPALACKHGVKAASDILDFLIELILKDPAMGREPVEETIVFALDMVHAALLAVGPDLAHFEVLVYQIHVDLLHAMCQAAIEVVMDRVLLPLADGKNMNSIEQQEAALEGVLDMCRQPGFVHDIFANCDCRLERGDLFADMCTLLSKTAMPAAKGSPGSLQFISLEALLAIFNAIAAENRSNAFQPPSAELELPYFIDIWTPLVNGNHLDLTPLVEAGDAMAMSLEDVASVGTAASPAVARGGGGSAPGAPLSDFMRLRSVVYERHLKHKLSAAVQHFNQNHKKGFRYLQEKKLMPVLAGSALAATASPQDIASEDELSSCLGRFLHVCPGLKKDTIGELLGEGDPFYIKASACSSSPSGSQKIDRIINSFGRNFYASNQSIFKSADAAYVLAYSVIMLNTDRHNGGVKNKMSLEAFRRNLRGVNECQISGKSDFPEEFLNDIYYSIIKTPLRLNESSSMDVSEQSFVELHQTSATSRGQMIHSDPGRHLFDTTMFRLIWNPAVTTICAIIDSISNEQLVHAALGGLEVVAHIAACHQLDDVADTIILNLSKTPQQLDDVADTIILNLSKTPQQLDDVADTIILNLSKTPQQVAHIASGRPETAFGKDAKMKATTLTIANIANKHGDSLQMGWTNVMDLLVCFYRQQMLPESFSKALNGDGEGGLVSSGAPVASLKVRRALAKQQAASGNSYFKTLSSMLTLPSVEPEYPERHTTANERAVADATEELLASCAWEDIFTDSKFLKQESLVHLVNAIIWASGPMPRLESLVHLVDAIIWASGPIPRVGGPGASAAASAGWDVSELCLELLFTVLLRNRDRIGLLWPKIFDHFQKIFGCSGDVDPALVQKAIMAMMRLCQRLLPYKADMSEALMKGIQLVSLVESQVAWDTATTIAEEILDLLKGAAPKYHETSQIDAFLLNPLAGIQLVSLVESQVASDMATTIAEEILNLLKGAAPFIQHQPVWVSICGLIKIIQYDDASFSLCVDTVSWNAARHAAHQASTHPNPGRAGHAATAATQATTHPTQDTHARSKRPQGHAATPATASPTPSHTPRNQRRAGTRSHTSHHPDPREAGATRTGTQHKPPTQRGQRCDRRRPSHTQTNPRDAQRHATTRSDAQRHEATPGHTRPTQHTHPQPSDAQRHAGTRSDTSHTPPDPRGARSDPTRTQVCEESADPASLRRVFNLVDLFGTRLSPDRGAYGSRGQQE